MKNAGHAAARRGRQHGEQANQRVRRSIRASMGSRASGELQFSSKCLVERRLVAKASGPGYDELSATGPCGGQVEEANVIAAIAGFFANRWPLSESCYDAAWRLAVQGAVLALLACGAATAPGQVQQTPIVIGGQVPAGGGRSYPSPTYYLGFGPLNDGDYKNALEAFNRELRGAYRNGQSRWLDSICDYTMVGECEYRLGDYAAALENFEAALRLYMQTSDWMLHVQFPPTLGSSGNSRGAPWGGSTRGSHLARISDSLPIGVGQFNPAETMQVLQNGGVLRAPMFLSINAQEIVRCTCLAMMRRQEIVGPLVTRDTLTDEVLATATRRQGPPNHWSEAWLDAIQGTAYNSAGKTSQAAALLKRSMLMLGQYDHAVTGLALLQLGQIALNAGDYKTAAGYFEEASYSGYDYGDSTVIEQAFRKLFLAHVLTGDTQILEAPFASAAAWAKAKNREIQASVLVMGAESLAMRGARQQAASVLADAAGVIGRRTMGQCEIGSALQYVTAMTQYEAGAIPAGDTALNSALQWYKNGGSLWLFQISLTDNLCQTNPNGRFDHHSAFPLYAQVLRDPTPSDWLLQPLDSLAVMSTPHPLPFEHWFNIAVDQGASAEAVAQGRWKFLNLRGGIGFYARSRLAAGCWHCAGCWRRRRNRSTNKPNCNGRSC